MKKALIIESDVFNQKTISDSLRSYDFIFDLATDGEEAVKMLKDTDYDLIIIDWKTTRISAQTIVTFVKQQPRYLYLPILVTCSFSQKMDFSVLREFFFIKTLDKPLDTHDIVQKYKTLVAQKEFVKNFKEKINSFMTDNFQFKNFVLSLFKAKTDSFLPFFIIARELEIKGAYVSAINLIETYLLQKEPSNEKALNELARLYIVVGRLNEAKDVIEKLNKKNLTSTVRLNFLGKIHLNVLDFERAAECFSMSHHINKTLGVEGMSEILDFIKFADNQRRNKKFTMVKKDEHLFRYFVDYYQSNTNKSPEALLMAVNWVSNIPSQTEAVNMLGEHFYRNHLVEDGYKWLITARGIYANETLMKKFDPLIKGIKLREGLEWCANVKASMKKIPPAKMSVVKPEIVRLLHLKNQNKDLFLSNTFYNDIYTLEAVI